VKAIIAVERRVLTFKPATGLWKSSSERAFYLSNRHVPAGQAADAIRKHWGIENKQHYSGAACLARVRNARLRPTWVAALCWRPASRQAAVSQQLENCPARKWRGRFAGRRIGRGLSVEDVPTPSSGINLLIWRLSPEDVMAAV
jgi:hypothetical protein